MNSSPTGGRSDETFSGGKKTFWSSYKLTIYLLWSSAHLVPVLHSHKAPSQAQRRPEMQDHLQTDSRCRSWRKGCHSSLHLTNLGSSPRYQHWINKRNHIISGLLALLEQNSNKRSKDGKTKQRRAQSTDPWTVLWFALKTNRNILCYWHADVSGISPHKTLKPALMKLQDQVSVHNAAESQHDQTTWPRVQRQLKNSAKVRQNRVENEWLRYPDWPPEGAT